MLIRLSSDTIRRGIVAGASTLTMQLARDLFPEEVGFVRGEKSPERKIKEILVAIQIEKRYTKREILTFYAIKRISATAQTASKLPRDSISASARRT